MRKLFLIIVVFFIFLFGLTIGGNYSKGSSKLFEESKKDFESEITNPNNDYNNVTLVPEDSMINKTARKLEDAIDRVIDKIFSFLS